MGTYDYDLSYKFIFSIMVVNLFLVVWLAILVSSTAFFSKVALVGSQTAREHILIGGIGDRSRLFCLLTSLLFTC